MGKYLILTGLIIAGIGLLLWLAGNKLHWLGNLPGDIRIEKPSFSFYMPITTMLLLSVAASVLWWIIRKFF